MPAYGQQVVAEDRWKIVRYLRRLQAGAGPVATAAPAPAPAGPTPAPSVPAAKPAPSGGAQ
jgi:hypothetical protein